MKLLNDPHKSTRIDPATGLGLTLDLGLVSTNIAKRVVSFEVDTNKEWTPFAICKRGGTLEKKFSDHRSICLKVKLPLAKTEKKRKVQMIDRKNPEGWSKYKEESNKIANMENYRGQPREH